MPLYSWSRAAGSNTGILSGLTLDGSVMTPGQVDNAFRDMAAQLATQVGLTGYKGADIASAGTTNLANATGWFCDVTGTTTITAFGTVDAGQMFMLRFAGVLVLTYNASSLILPGAASKTTAANDVAIMLSLGSGNWQCVSYQQAVTTSLTITPPTQQTFLVSGTWTKPTGCTRVVIEAVGGGGGSGGINGTAAASGVTAGGGSGFYGMTAVLDVSAVVSAAVTIGAAGTAGNASTNGGAGGNTAITIGATTYTWGGGGGSDFRNAGTSTFASMEGGLGGTGTNVTGGSEQGTTGMFSHTDLNVTSGAGGSTPLGTGGRAIHSISSGVVSGGQAAAGRGAGGGGAINLNSNSDQAGAVGTAGYMRIWEYYS